MFLDKDILRFWSHVDVVFDKCWTWKKGTDKDGYGYFGINKKTYRTNRLSFMIYHNREITKDMCICHSCNNRKCVNPFHLFEGTHDDNMKHMIATGRSKLCGKPQPELLNDKQILEIKSKYNKSKGITYKVLANEYGCSINTIRKAILK
jgi:hypothetical protein